MPSGTGREEEAGGSTGLEEEDGSTDGLGDPGADGCIAECSEVSRAAEGCGEVGKGDGEASDMGGIKFSVRGSLPLLPSIHPFIY